MFTLNTLLDYGVDRTTLVAEIKAELLLRLTMLIETQFFDLTNGSGLAGLENEMIPHDALVVLGTLLVTAVADYSNSVPDNRKVVTSQDWVNMEQDNEGNLVLQMYFVLYTDMQNPVFEDISKIFNL